MGFNTFPCNPYPISTEELNKGNNDDLNTRVAALESDVSDLNSNKANQITIAPFFNAETAYTAGDLVYYNGLSYRCTNDHEGEWDADDFAATTIANELDTLKSGLNNVWPCDIIKYGAYIGTGGGYINFAPYYIAKIPVEAGHTYHLVNSAGNESTYNKFLDASDEAVGELIQNVDGGGITVTAPSGAVSMLVTMYVKSGNPQVQFIS